MAVRFTGNTSGTANSSAYTLPMFIDNFLLVNKTAGVVVANVYRIGSVTVNLTPLGKSMAAGEVYESTRQTVLLATETIRVQVSGSTDYDFTISESIAPLNTEET